MTRTTRKTTRKAPWAAALTALLAVLALVFGALVLAGPANADPDGNNGNAGNPPGQSETFVPPGQENTPGGGNDKPDEYLPPGQNPDWTPPGQVTGSGPGSPGYKVWICHADTNHGNGQPNLGVNGTGGEFGTGFNLLHVSWSAWINSHNRLHPNDYVTTETAGCPTLYYCPTGTEYGGKLLTAKYDPLAKPDVCNSTCVDGVNGPYGGAAKLCTEQKVDCVDGVSGTYGGDAKLCSPPKVYCPPTAPVNANAEIPAGQTEATYCTTSTNTTSTELPIVAATVAAPEAGTVETPQAAVPEPGTAAPMPATVPAGDGSTAPQPPVALLGLLGLATATALVTGRRLVTNR